MKILALAAFAALVLLAAVPIVQSTCYTVDDGNDCCDWFRAGGGLAGVRDQNDDAPTACRAIMGEIGGHDGCHDGHAPCGAGVTISNGYYHSPIPLYSGDGWNIEDIEQAEDIICEIGFRVCQTYCCAYSCLCPDTYFEDAYLGTGCANYIMPSFGPTCKNSP